MKLQKQHPSIKIRPGFSCIWTILTVKCHKFTTFLQSTHLCINLTRSEGGSNAVLVETSVKICLQNFYVPKDYYKRDGTGCNCMV